MFFRQYIVIDIVMSWLTNSVFPLSKKKKNIVFCKLQHTDCVAPQSTNIVDLNLHLRGFIVKKYY